MTSTLERFTNLAGSWSFARTILAAGSVQGEATFTKEGHFRFNYKEQGIYTTLQGTTFNTYQEYTFRYEDGQIVLYFKDGRPFYTLQFSENFQEASACHLCLRDTYRALYTFTSNDAFSLHYDIRGPNKDYSITTNFYKRG